MRRLLICVMILGLIAMAPGPASLCALTSSMGADCAAAAAHADCDQMDMGTPSSGPALAAATRSCCTISQAPLPEATNARISVVDQGRAPIAILAIEVTHSGIVRSGKVLQESPSPPLQCVLCTFLI